MRQLMIVAGVLSLASCAHTTLNGVAINEKRTGALTAIGVVGAALILAAERNQDAVEKTIPEYGCDACAIEKLPGPVPRD